MDKGSKDTLITAGAVIGGLWILGKSGFAEGAVKGGFSEAGSRIIERVSEVLPAGMQEWLSDLKTNVNNYFYGDSADTSTETTTTIIKEDDQKDEGEGTGDDSTPEDDGKGDEGGGGVILPDMALKLRQSGAQAGLILLRNTLGSALTGAKWWIQPFGKTAVRTGLGKGIVNWITRGSAATVSHATGAAAAKAFIAQTSKTALRAGGMRVGTGAAARAIPVVGYALLVADAVADTLRFMGFDVTEWLGYSALATPFLGYNLLEAKFNVGSADAYNVSSDSSAPDLTDNFFADRGESWRSAQGESGDKSHGLEPMITQPASYSEGRGIRGPGSELF